MGEIVGRPTNPAAEALDETPASGQYCGQHFKKRHVGKETS